MDGWTMPKPHRTTTTPLAKECLTLGEEKFSDLVWRDLAENISKVTCQERALEKGKQASDEFSSPYKIMTDTRKSRRENVTKKGMDKAHISL